MVRGITPTGYVCALFLLSLTLVGCDDHHIDVGPGGHYWPTVPDNGTCTNMVCDGRGCRCVEPDFGMPRPMDAGPWGSDGWSYPDMHSPYPDMSLKVDGSGECPYCAPGSDLGGPVADYRIPPRPVDFGPVNDSCPPKPQRDAGCQCPCPCP
jgi:hypothetical protein